MSEIFHDADFFYHGHEAGEITHRLQGQQRLAGPRPERASYGSFATYPDGNGWVLQEITQRLPGR
ncbi:hypothetical protein ACWDWS_09310 [Streptomyces sp. NPDC003328]|uniref:hypothetical protein n=1 Tax=Streptomyces TaxID=1883 RepID=UPI00367C947A